MVKPIEPKQHLTLADYNAHAAAANQFKGTEGAVDQLRFGLFGEVGGVLAAVKKSNRDLGPAEQSHVIEELGDALWYLSTVSAECGATLPEVGCQALAEMQQRLQVQHEIPVADSLTFSQFDGLVALCRGKFKGLSRVEALSRLGADTGRLMIAGTKDLAAHSHDELMAHLLADIVMVAALFGLSIEKIAEENIQKFQSRWPPTGAQYLRLFDEDRSKLEQLPRQLSMHFIERTTSGGKPYVIQQLNGVNIGDRLTDNRTKADGYRFHDVFHLAYMAHLGWSPVIRALLKLKRKSDPDLDENQDGARAIIIEEGIATWIFNHAHQRDYFQDTPPGKLEYGLLKQVRDMVEGYEVAACPLWQWERAILDGFSIFRILCEAGRGIVHVDLEKHTISLETLDIESEPPRKQRRPPIVGTVLPPPEM